jgi:N-acetylglutamate synthase-like GNAT family acetyltransferase
MIRPVLFVDLPGIIYALDRRVSGKKRANFVCWLEPVEDYLTPSPLLRNLLPFMSSTRTWICEDHWRLLGFAQVRERPSHEAWDMSYLASMVQRTAFDDDVISALLEYTLEMAATHGILRVFAKMEEDVPEFTLFQRSGFQRYARELTYVYSPADKRSSEVQARPGMQETREIAPSSVDARKEMQEVNPSGTPTPLGQSEPLSSLRRWNRHYTWGLHQLYRAATPQRVQMAELLQNSEEYTRLYIGTQHSLFSPFSGGNENYICDVGVRVGAWLRLCRGQDSKPNRIFLVVHPEHADLAEPLLRFGMARLQAASGMTVRPIYCMVREYDSIVITALRDCGFEETGSKALLVRHMAQLAMRQSTVPLLEQRAVYGVKGLGTVNPRQKVTR